MMAERYGFEYELVEYQWPGWLHGQTQKQRIIWGYKILFLDVLFPLGVKKIIFVDADQVYSSVTVCDLNAWTLSDCSSRQCCTEMMVLQLEFAVANELLCFVVLMSAEVMCLAKQQLVCTYHCYLSYTDLQIVRADLKELLEIPLDGAPYGYTPFCNDRPDMAGFRYISLALINQPLLITAHNCRFWESGYWKNHLGNRRYHISALYVVDLMRFRQLAAGDRLRGQYQALSQDPNSLANLDQDLPNNMIHMVPIKSLPQEWLWCETWCSLESKEKAKTIDLVSTSLVSVGD